MNGAFSVKVRRLIFDRDDCSCALCGRLVVNPIDYTPLIAYSLQHRLARGSGGTSRRLVGLASNGVTMCGHATSPDGCHAYVESHPDEARRLGYRVNHPTDPATVPLWHTAFGWVLLTAAGGVVSQEVTG